MKLIIAGSRNIDKDGVVAIAMSESWFANCKITQIFSGGARGVDRLGESYGRQHKIPVITFNANWDKYGKKAGPMRNQEMVDLADALLAIWDGKSRGTADIVRKAKTKGLRVYVYRI